MKEKIINFRGIQFYDMDFRHIINKLENKGGGITWEWGDPLLVD